MDIQELRKRSGKTQTEFWAEFGCSQSSGSRYESDTRDIPKSVSDLLYLATASEHKAKAALMSLRIRVGAAK